MIHAKNYETVSKFVKVMTKILRPLFFPDTVPIAATNCLKPKFTLVTSSAVIAIITWPQGRTGHSKINNIHLVRFI